MKTKTIQEPCYYAVLPANVRYSKKISSTGKLLFAEITALSNQRGYSWAGNSYFSDLLGVSDRQISNLIKELRDNNFIDVVIESGNERKIYPKSDLEISKIRDESFTEKFDRAIGTVSLELKDEREAFIEYWTATNDGSKKQHWQKQKTFAIKQRWNTWIRNLRKFQRSKPLPSDEELRKNAELERKRQEREKAQRAELEKVGKPRSPEEQARINKQLNDLRNKLGNKFSLK